MKAVRRSVYFCVALCCISCQGRAPAAASSPDDRETSAYRLEVVDSIGIESGDSCYVFGDATSADFTSDGGIVVLDGMNCRVSFFDSTGEFSSSLSIQGQGPGEFNSPTFLKTLPGGGFLIFGQEEKKICFYDIRMNLLDEHLFSAGNQLGPYKVYPLSDTSFVANFSILSADWDSVSTDILLLCGDSTTTIARRSAPYDPDYRWQQSTAMVFTTAPDGSILVANISTEEWRIARFDQTGLLLGSIERDYEPTRKSDEQISDEMELGRQRHLNATGSLNGFNWQPDEYLPSIREIQVDSLNRVWVRRGGYLEAVYDVMTIDGEDLFTAAFTPPQWLSCFTWNLKIGTGEYLARPYEPDDYPLVYRLELVEEE